MTTAEIKDAVADGTERMRFPGPAAKYFAAALCLFCVLYVIGAFAYFKIYFLRNQFNAIFLSGALLLIFLRVPAGKRAPRDRLPWYDILLILGSLTGTLYITINALTLAYFARISASPLEMALGLMTLLILMEAVRRTMGWAMVIVSAIFVLYAGFGANLPGAFGFFPLSWSRIANDVYLSSEGIFGELTSTVATIILIYIVFGVFFSAAGGGKFFQDLAMALVGSIRGGPAKASIVASALFGMISGSPVANVAVTGAITIPMMKKSGYQPDFAGAVECVASTGGCIMPPVLGVTAFIMADRLGVEYASIALIAIIPAILYYTALYTQTDFRAAKLKLQGLPRHELPSMGYAMKTGWPFLIPMVMLVVFLLVLRYPAGMSAIYSVAAVILVGMFRKETRLNLKKIIDSLANGLVDTLPIAALCGLAGIFIGILTMTGLGPTLSAGLVSLAGGSVLALAILAAVACYIMGMGASALANYIILSTLIAPAFAKMGVPLTAAHFFVLYMGITTFFTPPYAPACFVAVPFAGASATRIGLQAMRLGIVCFLVPFIFIFRPALILIGTPIDTVGVSIAGFLGVIALSVGIERFMFDKLHWLLAIASVVAGIMLFYPNWISNLIGGAVLSVIALWNWRTAKATKTPLASSASP